MKTSILVSGFAALCLMLTFAEAPRRHSGDKINVAYTSNIAIPRIDRVTMLPGVYITADRKKEATVAVPVIPAEDFSYLEFDVNEFLETNSVNYAEAEVLMPAVETDFSYLKFNVSDFITDSDLTGDEISELPVNEEYNSSVFSPEPAVMQFEYIRFNVNDYISNTFTEAGEIGELPAAESETADQFGYLKFDVTKYFSASDLSAEVQFELPEE